MKHNFSNLTGLIVNGYAPSQRMLTATLKILGFASTTAEFNAELGFMKFKEEKHDIVLADIQDGLTDGIGFAKRARNDNKSPNKKVPIICIAGPKAVAFADQARQTGVSEFLEVPYNVDDIANRIAYVLSEGYESISYAGDSAPDQDEILAARSLERPSEDESFELTMLLLEHYSKHHEIVLTKLKFAQGATKASIDHVRNAHNRMVSDDEKNLSLSNNFETMWSEIIQQFQGGGVSQEDMKKIEGIIISMPEHIKSHYDTLSQQNQEFLDKIESLNAEAYKKALEKAAQVQSEPNILSGLTAQDYQSKEKVEEKGQEQAGDTSSSETPSWIAEELSKINQT